MPARVPFIDRFLKSREYEPPVDALAPLRNALSQAVEANRLLSEHLADIAAKALDAQERAAAANNPLAVAFSAGEQKAIMAILALAGAGPKE